MKQDRQRTKVIAGIAGIVCLFVPPADMGVLVFGVALVVAIIIGGESHDIQAALMRSSMSLVC